MFNHLKLWININLNEISKLLITINWKIVHGKMLNDYNKINE